MSPITSQYAEIVQYEPTKNIFLVQQNGQEVFQLSFADSIIRRFYTVSLGYILIFQTCSAIALEKGNICLVSFSGDIVWWVEKQTRNGYLVSYINFRFDRDYLVADDGSHDCWIDVRNGKIIKSEKLMPYLHF